MNAQYTYLVFSIKLVRYLQKEGFYFVSARPDKEIENRVVFIYEKTPELLDAVNDFLKMYGRESVK